MKIKMTCLLICFFFAAVKWGYGQNRDIYEIKIYHISSAAQAAAIDQFLADAYLPAIDRKSVV